MSSSDIKPALSGRGQRFRRPFRSPGGAARDGSCHPDGPAGRRRIRRALVLSGDVPLLKPETIARLRDFHIEQRAAMTILTAAPRPHQLRPGAAKEAGFARSYGDRRAEGAYAETAGRAGDQLRHLCISTEPLFAHINELKTENAHGEYYLTDMAGLLDAGERVVAVEAASRSKCWARTRLPR